MAERRRWHLVLHVVRLILTVYICWLAMMAVHEAGHVLHAWLTGGHVRRVVLPLLGFSRTDVDPDPSPAFVTWGGPVWGSLLPVIAWGIIRTVRQTTWPTFRFFVGFCLICNGAYLGAGWAAHSGDARDLVMIGTPRFALILFGAATVPAGLWIWHRLGPVCLLWSPGRAE